MGYPRPFCLHASASLEAGSPSKPGLGAGGGLQGCERLHLLRCPDDSRRQLGLGPVLLQATWRTVPPNRGALTRKVGVQCHPVFSQKPSRHPDGWFFCRAELRPREREGRRWDVSLPTPPRVKGRSLHLPRLTPEGRSHWSGSQVPVFPRMGRPPRPSAIPGDLDRETAFKWRGRGSLEPFSLHLTRLDLTRALREFVLITH